LSATADHVEQPLPAERAGQTRALTPAELAWVALIPCAVVMIAAIVVLGPPLGHAAFRHGSDALWPTSWWEARGRPEPVKHMRYLIAAAAPGALAAVVLLGGRGGGRARLDVRLRPRTIRLVTVTGYALISAVLVLSVLGQDEVLIVGRQQLPKQPIFTLLTYGVSAALVGASLLALRRERFAGWLARLGRETTARRVACLAIVVVFAALWLLETVTTDRLVEDQGQMNWTLNDVFAVLNGRTPLVDYHLIYGKLAPYPAALALSIFGKTAFVYTLLLMICNLLTLLLVYAVLRRVTRSSVYALALFVPFLAVSDIRHTMINAGMWPMRYGASYVVLWMTARHIDGERPRRTWSIFLVGGLGAINAMEFGAAVIVASLVALLCARPPRTVRDVWPLARECALGVGAAVVLVAGYTLARAGELPSVSLLMEWPRIFTNLGWFSLPIPGLALHLPVYGTFAAAIVVAAVRLARKADDALLSSLLMWSGVFGLVAGSYYVGRAEDFKLISMFSAWGLTLALLTVVCVRALAARGWRAPAFPELLILFGFALAICAISQMPPPRAEIRRLTQDLPPPTYRASAEAFVAAHTQPGEKVVILMPEGHRIADRLGLENVSPFGIVNAIVSQSQMKALIDTIRREGVTEIFMPSATTNLAGEGNSSPEHFTLLESLGYPVRDEEAPGMVELRRSG
jgi:hypothetical protein